MATPSGKPIEPSPPRRGPRPRHLLRRGAAAGSLLLLVWLLHAPLLRSLANFLVAEQTQPASGAVLILGGDRCFEVAARGYLQGEADTVLLCETQPGRLVLLKILPSGEEIARRELVSRGVPIERIVLLANPAEVRCEAVPRLTAWLAEHPQKKVTVLCDRFGSALLSQAYDREIAVQERSRVGIWALRDRRYDETNWWRSGVGIKAFFRAVFDQVYARVRGAESNKDIDFDPDAYEKLVFEDRPKDDEPAR